jgi:hypothetical protein
MPAFYSEILCYNYPKATKLEAMEENKVSAP